MSRIVLQKVRHETGLRIAAESTVVVTVTIVVTVVVVTIVVSASSAIAENCQSLRQSLKSI